MRPSSLLPGGLAMLLASAFGNGLSYVFGVFLARQLGAESFGDYALALTVFNVVSLTLVCGLDSATLKFVTQRRILEGNGCDRATLLLTILPAALLGGAAGGALLAGAGPIAAMFGSKTLRPLLLGFALAVPFATVAAVGLAATQAAGTIGRLILIRYVWEPVVKFGLAALAVWMGYAAGGVVAAVVVAVIGTAVLSVRQAWRLCRSADPRTPFPSRDAWVGLLGFCAPLAAANVFGVLGPRVDVLLLGYWSAGEEVGIYAAAFQTAAMLALVLGAFDSVLAPTVGAAVAGRDRTGLRETYAEGTRLVLMLTLPLAAGMIVFAPEILSLFGGTFVVQGRGALILLVLAHVVNSGLAFANSILLMSGRTRLVLMNTALYALAVAGAGLVLVPGWGLMGAALSAAGGLVLVNGLRVWQVWRLEHVHPFRLGLLRLAAAALGTTVVMWGAKLAWAGVPLPVLCVCLLAVHGGFMWVFGLDPRDQAVMRSLAARVRPMVVPLFR